jgi:hypothetical protein
MSRCGIKSKESSALFPETINNNYKVNAGSRGGTTLNSRQYSNSTEGMLLRVSPIIILRVEG